MAEVFKAKSFGVEGFERGEIEIEALDHRSAFLVVPAVGEQDSANIEEYGVEREHGTSR